MAAYAIETRMLTKRYGDAVVVDRLNLEVAAGEIFGLLGPNGAGKTTTILMLLGLAEPTGGSATVLGREPFRDPLAVKRRVGYLPDAVGFYDGMSGRQNLRFTARLNRLPTDQAEPAIERVLAEVGLTDASDRPVGEFSRGMRQRLGIADALLKDPTVLILDEPTTAIDPEGVQEILALIRTLADRGVAVLLSSHLLHQVQTVCDRVAIFVRGRVAAMGTPQALANEASGPEMVEIGVSGDADLETVLAGSSDVMSVTPGKHRGTWLVSVPPGRTPELVSSLVGAGIGLTGVRRTAEDLDDVYRRYFDREASHDARV
ncbi:MAG: ABC transporter ATP-binding protein [Acidimicrobiia bacterium]|nr:ABC transporter ATP-binding protein [Acidimicrobiia bacterium]MDH5293453.1 ABC transporter ATP-binding protein [Acidimicrobiia bacterium]